MKFLLKFFRFDPLVPTYRGLMQLSQIPNQQIRKEQARVDAGQPRRIERTGSTAADPWLRVNVSVKRP